MPRALRDYDMLVPLGEPALLLPVVDFLPPKPNSPPEASLAEVDGRWLCEPFDLELFPSSSSDLNRAFNWGGALWCLIVSVACAARSSTPKCESSSF